MNTLNITAGSSDWRGKRCSNFSHDPFMLDGVELASVEGFVQGTKWPEGHPNRVLAFTKSGKEAKKLGNGAARDFVYWDKQTIVYGSPEHHALIERAICAKFTQNPEARVALLATGDLTLTHDLGEPESPSTSFPAAVFVDVLTRIREGYKQGQSAS